MRLKLFATIVFGSLLLAVSPAFATKLLINISKVSQKMTVTVDGEREYQWKVSTGGVGYDTPAGTFRPFRLEKEHFSKEWDDAPMPNSIFFTGQGHAIHGSYHIKRLGTRASHGCVRLAPENAVRLFALVQKAGMSNTTIVVKGGFFEPGDELYALKKKTLASLAGPTTTIKKAAKDTRKKLANSKTKKGKKPFWWLAENED